MYIYFFPFTLGKFLMQTVYVSKVNPKFDPWSVPHSCGNVCARHLTPDCGHSCLLLCHPGNKAPLVESY